jgi:flagellin
MGFRINTNIAAMNSHNSALMNNRNLDSSLGKLSSGLRINTAADDSSGLAIADSLRSQASSLGQAVKNGNDAIGLLQTADGALSEYSNILDTIKTKATQAASDGQNTTSRQAIQKDIDALMKELNTIAKTTSFNGQKLLSGTFNNKEFQMGANANESVTVNIGSTETSQIGQTTRGELTLNKLGENQLTLKSATTGKSLTLNPVNLQYNNTAAGGMGGVADQINKYSGETGISAKAVVTVSTGVISAGSTSADFAINGINIGVIQVDKNDDGGTLQNAINAKTTETGVTATRTTDGQLELSTNDGRALKVQNLTGIAANTDKQMTTMGSISITQAGSSDFEIQGAQLGTAVGADITTTGSTTMLEDSTLAIGSSIIESSTLAAGSVLGANIAVSDGDTAASATADSFLVVGSVIGSGATLNKDTVLGTEAHVSATTTLSSDMLVKAGSVLTTGTIFDAGTVLQQDFTVSNTLYKAGMTLTTDLTLTASTTLSKDMTIHVGEGANAQAAIGDASKLATGTVLGADIVISSKMTLDVDMTFKAGSVIGTGSTYNAGSIVGEEFKVSATTTTTAASTLKVGSVLFSGSSIKENSTLGGLTTTKADLSLNQDMNLKAGSVLASGSILKAGTIVTQDLTAAQAGNVGVGIKAGTVLGTDLTVTDTINLTEDMTILQGGTDGLGHGKITAGSKIAANGGDRSSVNINNKEFTSLADINVTTLKGAMNAIDTLSAAITNLDTIRSNIGSAQNQVTSTINNISVTQVNVKAAESSIRDVDFAAESANFSKFNILAQSGSYAMSQANAVQQNVMRLLQ